MKKLFTILFSSLYFFAQAQTPGSPIGGIVVKGGKTPGGNLLVSLSGGISNPSSVSKTNAKLVNGYTFNGNVYVPLFARDGGLAGRTSHFFTIGINAGGEYFMGNKDHDLNALPSYQISGQSTVPTISLSTDQNKQHGFKAEAGVQANFTFGQLTISPLVDAGYFSLQQKALSVTQSGSVNGKTYSKEIYTQGAVKTTGFAISPILRIAYFPGKLGFYVEGSYTSGPSIKNEATIFKPQGDANANGFYSQDQMMAGANERTSENVKFNSLGLNFGLSIPLGKATRKPRGKVTKPGDNGMLKAAATSTDRPVRTYTAGRKNENTQQMTVPYTGTSTVLKDIKVTILGTGATLSDGTPIIAGKTVTGKITKGGNGATSASYAAGLVIKQPETGDEGSATSDQAGNFEIILGHDTLHRIYINNEEFGKIKLVSNPSSAERQTPNTSFGQRLAAPGNPIGGIIVKGGKNPGPASISVITNENGEFEFTANEAGNYRFSLSSPESQGKSISEQGVKRTEDVAMAKPGNPIGGIIVKGGKNPGGNLITVNTNEQGEFELKKLEGGNYKFTIIAPENPQGKSISTKGVSSTKNSGKSKKN